MIDINLVQKRGQSAYSALQAWGYVCSLWNVNVAGANDVSNVYIWTAALIQTDTPEDDSEDTGDADGCDSVNLLEESWLASILL